MRRVQPFFAALLVATTLALPAVAHAVSFSLINADSVGEGFNDPTPAAPVGGNPGTTIGQQRQNVFLRAAQIWGSILPGTVPIVVYAEFNPLSCTANAATLGSAGPLNVFRDFGGEFAGTWYTEGQANQVLGFDADPATPELRARFNRRLGELGCLTGVGWYYGLDHNPGSQINLLSTVLHEMGHGLGFLELVNEPTGQFLGGFPDVFTRFIRDLQLNKTWNVMTDAERIASSTRDGQLVWDGKAVTTKAATYLQQDEVLQVLSPPAIAGEYRAGIATFGAQLTRDGTTGAVVLANDGTAPNVNDACTPLTNAAAIAGNIALVDRGNCTFAVKAANAQAAGAIGVLIANNVAGNTPPSLSGVDPSIIIPVLGLSQPTGNTLKGQLVAGVTVTMQLLGPDRLAGANPSRKVYLYAPLAYAAGSSISHFDVSATPGLLMEPFDTGLGSDDPDLTTYAFEDIGWFNPRITAAGDRPAPAAGSLTSSPNPFRQSTTVSFALPRAGLTEVAVFDLSGREVVTLAKHWLPAGAHRLSWSGVDADGRRLPAGVYLYRVRLGSESWSERVVLLD